MGFKIPAKLHVYRIVGSLGTPRQHKRQFIVLYNSTGLFELVDMSSMRPSIRRLKSQRQQFAANSRKKSKKKCKPQECPTAIIQKTVNNCYCCVILLFRKHYSCACKTCHFNYGMPPCYLKPCSGAVLRCLLCSVLKKKNKNKKQRLCREGFSLQQYCAISVWKWLCYCHTEPGMTRGTVAFFLLWYYWRLQKKFGCFHLLPQSNKTIISKPYYHVKDSKKTHTDHRTQHDGNLSSKRVWMEYCWYVLRQINRPRRDHAIKLCAAVLRKCVEKFPCESNALSADKFINPMNHQTCSTETSISLKFLRCFAYFAQIPATPSEPANVLGPVRAGTIGTPDPMFGNTSSAGAFSALPYNL